MTKNNPFIWVADNSSTREPQTDKQREPDVEPLRQINCKACKELAKGMCQPDGIPHMFIEDSLKPIDNTKGGVTPDVLGCIVEGDEIDPNTNPNDCRAMIEEKFTIEEDDVDLEAVIEMYGEFMKGSIHGEDDEWATEGAENMIALTEIGCEMTKTYKIEAKCKGTLYLARNKESDAIEEVCIKDLADPN